MITLWIDWRGVLGRLAIVCTGDLVTKDMTFLAETYVENPRSLTH